MSVQFSAQASFAATAELIETPEENYMLRIAVGRDGAGQVLLEHLFTNESAEAFISAVERVRAGSEEICGAEWEARGQGLQPDQIAISWRRGFWYLEPLSSGGVTVSIRAPLFATLVGAVASRFHLDAPEMPK